MIVNSTKHPIAIFSLEQQRMSLGCTGDFAADLQAVLCIAEGSKTVVSTTHRAELVANDSAWLVAKVSTSSSGAGAQLSDRCGTSRVAAGALHVTVSGGGSLSGLNCAELRVRDGARLQRVGADQTWMNEGAIGGWRALETYVALRGGMAVIPNKYR